MSKKDRQAKAAAATPAPAVTQAVAQAVQGDNALEWLFNALEASVKVAAIKDEADRAGSGVSGLVMKVACAAGSLDSFNATIKRFNAWLVSDAGIKQQQAHGIKLPPTKSGKGVKLPGTFKGYVTYMRRYLEARSVNQALPAPETFSSFKDVRKQLNGETVQKALAEAKVSARKLTEAERKRLLVESDTHRHLANEIRLIGDRVAKLTGDRLDACVAHIHACAEAIGKLDAERQAEENAAKAAKQAAKEAKAQLPEALEETAETAQAAEA